MTPIFVMVTGGRGYGDYEHVARVLDEEHKQWAMAGMPFVIVQGGASGADALAKQWCRNNGLPCLEVEANWKHYGRSAGPVRNAWMLDLLPIYKVVAFPGGAGTANAIKQAERREILVRIERGNNPQE